MGSVSLTERLGVLATYISLWRDYCYARGISHSRMDNAPPKHEHHYVIHENMKNIRTMV